MSVSLNTLLARIQDGKAINIATLIKIMPNNMDWRELFVVEHMVTKNTYKLNIVDELAFSRLLQQSQLPTNRAHAASHTIVSSHFVPCDSAYMLCFPAYPSFVIPMNGQDTNERPLLPVATAQQSPLPRLFRPAKNAILIENQDCFFAWHTFMANFSSSLNLARCDIYFAGGSRILNPSLADFLKPYHTLYTAFDYDLDGLKIAQHLIKKQYAHTHILLPDKLKELVPLFTCKPTKLDKLLAAVDLCKEMHLPELHEIFITSKHFMEQEALLTLNKGS